MSKIKILLKQLYTPVIFAFGIVRLAVYCIFSLFLYSQFLTWFAETSPDYYASTSFIVVRICIIVVILYYAFKCVQLSFREVGK